ncbi:tRNA (guanosine(46)-N7)-methyltransferase TrmB [Myxosarcina sp. GI1]|uniref:tRNA (guanosine(46)-N7)-methyltransferase TrmB n=1 Tax=Myxosarcina sp. GI1 TaxID=1541065 RepID=UPI00055FFA97|nr:tRNA (guanosine(46)-N7)-methyltransferase TrmB [Myxosarcina sp. GI1]
MPKLRVRQHVNPLTKKFQQPILLPDWNEIYSRSNRPLHLDIGCARGKFLLKLAQLHPETNFLGIEIRQSLVNSANHKKAKLNLSNLHYLFGNINNSAVPILKSFDNDVLKSVTIQFPDPWFKNKHHKRRVVQPDLVKTLSDYLVSGGTIFLQSDIKEVAQEMCDRFAANSLLVRQHQGWLETNPLEVPTERELFVLAQNKPVYRTLFAKA